jgi:cytoskeletal protein RodZ
LKDKLINKKYVRFSAITAVLVLSTIILTTIDGSQSYVFAQNSTSALNNAPITPAQGASDSEDESSSSDDSDNNDESDSSSGSDVDSNTDDSDSGQDTSSIEEDDDGIEEDSEQTNPLLDQIRNQVNGALSASGIPVP